MKDIVLFENFMDEDTGIDAQDVCFNCENYSGMAKGICSGSTPWMGKEVKYNNGCKAFQRQL